MNGRRNCQKRERNECDLAAVVVYRIYIYLPKRTKIGYYELIMTDAQQCNAVGQFNKDYLYKPLTSKEETRLSTLGNWVTLAIFRPLDTQSAYFHAKRRNAPTSLITLWKGWPKQALNKAVDDELFNANLGRVTSFIEETFNVTNPSKTPVGKATVGVLARALTLGVMVPYLNLQQLSARKSLTAPPKKVERSLLPLGPLYRGLERSLLKESVFTASYILGSAYLQDYLKTKRSCIHSIVCKVGNRCNRLPSMKALPGCNKEKCGLNSTKETKCESSSCERATDVAMASCRAAGAGVIATVITSPIDMLRVDKSLGTKAVMVARKAFRKGCYNGINTVIVQTLQQSKIHRRLLVSFLPPPPVHSKQTDHAKFLSK